MKIDNIKQLQKVIQLCRKLGVDALEIDNVKFNLGAAPKRQRRIEEEVFSPEANIRIPQYNPIVTDDTEGTADIIKTDELTQEQLLMWSATDSTVAEG
jgi:hypothetical protein